MQKTLFIKLSIIAVLCVIFAIGLNMFGSVIYERQSYAETVVAEIAEQHVNPQEIINPFIIIPTTVTPECLLDVNGKPSKCSAPYSKIETIFALQTQAAQNLKVSTDTYQRGIYHATSYDGDVTFNQNYNLSQSIEDLIASDNAVITDINTIKSANKVKTIPQQTSIHWDEVRLIIPVSDLRGVATLPTITINKQKIKATYPQTAITKNLTYIEAMLPKESIKELSNPQSETTLNTNAASEQTSNQTRNELSLNSSTAKPVNILIELSLAGISNLNTVPTGQNFELSMHSNWHAPNFIGKALPNTKNITANGFDANWQNQYLTIANNQYLSQCLTISNDKCAVDMVTLNGFGVSFAEPNNIYLQTERTMKYALLLILVSFGTFFLFEVIKSSRIHPIQYLLVGCALLVFYVLLLPLAEQVAFWQAYTVAASACVGLIGWYTYYVFGGIKRAMIFTAILAGLYAAFYGILTTEDLNLLLGAVFCFVVLACVMVMTRKIDWYQVT